MADSVDSWEYSGYLGAEAGAIRKIIRRTWGNLLRLANDANKLAHAVRRELPSITDDARRIVSTCVLVRVIDDHQGTTLLCRQGLVVQAGLLLRSMLEGVIVLRNICIDEHFTEQYIGSDFLDRLKLANVARESTHCAFAGIKGQALNDLIPWLKSQVEELGITRLGTEELAKRAGLHETYDTLYRLLSRDAHLQIRSLDRYFHTNADGDITSIDYTPRTDDLEPVVRLDVGMPMLALESVAEIFSLQRFAPDIERIKVRTFTSKQNRTLDNFA
jgi:hypothetical protein